jgi:peptide/nickel transport system ATP-binding protein
MQLLPNPAGRIVSGNIFFQGLDLTHLSIAEMENLRGNEIGMVVQEPMTALNPVQTIGRQLTEVLHLHTDQNNASALQAAVEILEKVGIPSPEILLSEYPHQLSGGMRQRVLIAIALVCSPSLLIADEPTTALDVTIQAQILDLIENLQKQLGMAVLMITHDLGVIAETCQDVVVMYAGKVVEKGSVFDIFDHPKHPYTQGLLRSIPRLDSPAKSKLEVIDGMVPGLLDLPSGCRFQNRCPLKTAQCENTSPGMEFVNSNHQVSCLNWKNP